MPWAPLSLTARARHAQQRGGRCAPRFVATCACGVRSSSSGGARLRCRRLQALRGGVARLRARHRVVAAVAASAAVRRGGARALCMTDCAWPGAQRRAAAWRRSGGGRKRRNSACTAAALRRGVRQSRRGQAGGWRATQHAGARYACRARRGAARSGGHHRQSAQRTTMLPKSLAPRRPASVRGAPCCASQSESVACRTRVPLALLRRGEQAAAFLSLLPSRWQLRCARRRTPPPARAPAAPSRTPGGWRRGRARRCSRPARRAPASAPRPVRPAVGGVAAARRRRRARWTPCPQHAAPARHAPPLRPPPAARRRSSARCPWLCSTFRARRSSTRRSVTPPRWTAR
jgi:hypothetical protein